MTQPSSGGPRYTMDTSVFPYTADTEGYKRLSGRPVNNFDIIFISRFLKSPKISLSFLIRQPLYLKERNK